LLSLVVVAAAVAGCKSGGGNECRARLIDAVPHRTGVRAVVDGETVLGPVGYGDVTDYRRFVPGRYAVRLVSDTGEVLHGAVALEKQRSQTVVAAPSGLIVVPIAAKPPNKSPRAWVVFVNAAAGGRAVDVAVNSIVAAPGLAPGAYSKPVGIDPGTFDVRAVAVENAGSSIDIVADGAITTQKGNRYVCVLMGGRGEPTVFKTFPDR